MTTHAIINLDVKLMLCTIWNCQINHFSVSTRNELLSRRARQIHQLKHFICKASLLFNPPISPAGSVREPGSMQLASPMVGAAQVACSGEQQPRDCWNQPGFERAHAKEPQGTGLLLLLHT